jgi:PTS system N-acetylgalactosamine-specific IIA component
MAEPPKTPPAPRAVVAGHAGFAAGIVSAVTKIAGRPDVFVAVSNEGLDLSGVENAIRAALKAHGAKVIFTDLPAGSCTMAARRVARLDSSIAIVTGVSVATLLDFALGDGVTELDLQRAAARGRESVTVVLPAGGPGAA